VNLTTAERDDLAAAEAVIERGLQTFVEVGEALARVRDARLYRATHETFEAYCRDRWNLQRTRAYELIEASATVAAVSELSDTVPTNEAQAKALRGLPPEEAAATMRKAHEDTDGKPTAAAIRKARHLSSVPNADTAPTLTPSGIEVPNGDDPHEYESDCHVDPSGGVNELRDLLRGWDKFLRNYYANPSASHLDALADWLDKQQRKTTRARRKTA